MLKVLAALDRLAPSWASSEELGLLGRGGTAQVRPTNLVVQAQLDEIRLALAPAAERWARRCGFRLPKAPYLALFPVKMTGDARSPAHQEPHTDSSTGQPGPPVCTVSSTSRRGRSKGALWQSRRRTATCPTPLTIHPTPNTIRLVRRRPRALGAAALCWRASERCDQFLLSLVRAAQRYSDNAVNSMFLNCKKTVHGRPALSFLRHTSDRHYELVGTALTRTAPHISFRPRRAGDGCAR